MTVVNAADDQKQRARFEILTETAQQQSATEFECSPFFVDLSKLPKSQLDHLHETGLLDKDNNVCLLRDMHEKYLRMIWDNETRPSLRHSFVSLDASRTWMIYWNLHAVDLLGRLPESKETQQEILVTLKTCFVETQVYLDPSVVVAEDAILKIQHIGKMNCFKAGAFGGGPGQLPHAATTYAAILALCILSSLESTALEFLEQIRPYLYVQFLAWKNQHNGAFRMHDDGETDVRASYCVMSVAKLLNISNAILEEKVADYIASCQTYEGGFGGESFAEAHGGYTFCGVATLALLNQFRVIDLQGLAGWLVRRQMSYEGGFNGRANKLVDGCYSFWQGSALAIVSQALDNPVLENDPWLDEKSTFKKETLLMDAPMLERYVLLCGQDVNGGLRDKPSKPRDFYHSCYCLSGLSLACHYGDEHYGNPEIGIGRTHPLYNIDVRRVKFILGHFYNHRSVESTG